MTTSELPEIGRWIKCTMTCDYDYKCKVMSYEDDINTISLDFNTGDTVMEQIVNIQYLDGSDDSLSKEDLAKYKWTYVQTPSEEELVAAVNRVENRRREISCAHCKSDTVILKACKACHNVYYCNQTCQRNDWSTHKDLCAYEKVRLKPDPRYLVRQAPDLLRAQFQEKLQSEYHAILMDALGGKFEVFHNGGFFWTPVATNINDSDWMRNPSSTDMTPMERYQLRHDSPRSEKSEPAVFKWRALESLEHGRGEPTGCSFIELMKCHLLDDERYRKGGLHYLSGSLEDPGLFWGMVINFNTFGTVAPFHSNCHCNMQRLPKKQRKMRNKWDKIFQRAKQDPLDVQCMFSEIPVGCLSFDRCPYKHDIEVVEKISRNSST